ncbi:hypothetical protein FIBSPDRAFT_943540 [Athelia psychrophila]|uniref:Uncharacterized protein n=1 Tax=Athelia psychrophila TaxID=1759441 RepID=A0A166VW69_9AGAM|nr:hypothetical protein FIBSPDRAFT_943540 [Fibularhizoctonia sp. CBS 109695]
MNATFPSGLVMLCAGDQDLAAAFVALYLPHAPPAALQSLPFSSTASCPLVSGFQLMQHEHTDDAGSVAIVRKLFIFSILSSIRPGDLCEETSSLMASGLAKTPWGARASPA